MSNPSYAMFSQDGDAAVHAIVEKARESQSTWPEVYRALLTLAEDYPEFGEVMDTAVRECVYDALGFDTPFYI